MNNPMVSIIVPVYNVENYLVPFYESIMKQTFQNFEIIMIDDGSTDNSLSVLYNLENTDHKLKVISQKNQGTGITRNVGIQQSSGKYLLFLDSDDTVSESLLEDNVKLLEDNDDASILVFGYDVYTNNIQTESIHFDNMVSGDIDNPDIFTSYYYQGVFNTLWNKMIRADIIKDNNLVSPNWPIAQDRGLLLEIVKFKPKVIFNKKKKAYYHYNFVRPGSTVATFKPTAIDSISKSIEIIIDILNGWGKQIPAKLIFYMLVNGLYFDAGILNASKSKNENLKSFFEKLNTFDVIKNVDSISILEWMKILNKKELFKVVAVKCRMGLFLTYIVRFLR